MNPITLRIPDDLLSEIESEAEELGYSSRAEYIRQLLQNREQARNALSTEDSASTVDPATVHSNTDQIESMQAELGDVTMQIEALESKVGALAEKIERNTTETDTATKSTKETLNQETGTATTIDELEEWLKQDGPQSEAAVKIIREAGIILKEDGPLKAGELKQRLHEAYPDAYSSDNTLWASTVERVYEDAPGFSKPGYGTYEFE